MRPPRGASVAALVLVGLVGLVALPARAALRESTIGNFYFQDDATGRRDRIEVDQGDQVRFTVRESSTTPHSVQVDELGISSPDLQLFDTYTTPPLDRAGTYRLYCRAHDDRGHLTQLVVRAAPVTTTTTTIVQATSTSAAPAATSTAAPATTTAAPAPPGTATDPTGPAPPATLAPVGLGTATDRRRAEPDPDSLAAILGRRPAEDGPWTRAVRMGLAALPVMILVFAGALYAAGRREGESGA